METDLSDFSQKLKTVQVAQREMKFVDQRLAETKKSLEEVKSKFVDRKNLSYVTDRLQRMAGRYDLDITDFSPVLDLYFNNQSNQNIKALPIAITLQGRYLQIGKFVDNFDQLNFYLSPQAIKINKPDKESNILEATVTCNLYTWN